MAQFQSISVTVPKMHGNAPKRSLAAIVRAPRRGTAPMKFNSFKDAMTYIKKQQIEELQDEYEG